MLTETLEYQLRYITTYKIKVVNESGSTSLLETGISTMYKPEYLQEHMNYLQECNPTKSFELHVNRGAQRGNQDGHLQQ